MVDKTSRSILVFLLAFALFGNYAKGQAQPWPLFVDDPSVSATAAMLSTRETAS